MCPQPAVLDPRRLRGDRSVLALAYRRCTLEERQAAGAVREPVGPQRIPGCRSGDTVRRGQIRRGRHAAPAPAVRIPAGPVDRQRAGGRRNRTARRPAGRPRVRERPRGADTARPSAGGCRYPRSAYLTSSIVAGYLYSTPSFALMPAMMAITNGKMGTKYSSPGRIRKMRQLAMMTE